MTVGFGSTTETKTQYIRNYMRHSNRLLCGFESLEEAVEEHQKAWSQRSSLRHFNFSKYDPLNPKYSILEIKQGRMGHQNTLTNGANCVFIGHNGLWQLAISTSASSKKEFTILVNCGGFYTFNPDIIEEVITTKFDASTYINWRQLIFDDINSLHNLVNAVRTEISQVVNSMTCGSRSKRLCERVGIPVHRDVAFLFPAKYN